MNDKELAERLVDAVENLYLENTVLKATVIAYQKHLPDEQPWQSHVAHVKKDAVVLSRVRRKFQPAHACLEQRADDLAGVVQQVLRALRGSGQVH